MPRRGVVLCRIRRAAIRIGALHFFAAVIEYGEDMLFRAGSGEEEHLIGFSTEPGRVAQLDRAPAF